jgi:uncharacterized protein (DUF4415 family)
MRNKDARGGARPGAGNKLGARRVAVKREQYPLTITPDVMTAFKEKYGRGWSRRVEELIISDLQNQS